MSEKIVDLSIEEQNVMGPGRVIEYAQTLARAGKAVRVECGSYHAAQAGAAGFRDAKNGIATTQRGLSFTVECSQ